MADKYIAHVKMAQIDWKKDPSKYINQPASGKMVQLSPRFVVPQNVLDTLRKVKAIGFNISGYPELMSLMQYQADSGIIQFIRDIGLGGDEEWDLLQQALDAPAASGPGEPEPTPVEVPQVEDTSVSMEDVYRNPVTRSLMESTMERLNRPHVPYLGPDGKPRRDTEEEATERARRTMQEIMESGGRPVNIEPKVSMIQVLAQFNSKQVELMQLLMDAGFVMNDIAKGREVLVLLGESSSPFAALAQDITQFDDVHYENLLVMAAEGMHQDTDGTVLDQTNIETPVPQMNLEPQTNIEQDEMPASTPPTPTPPPAAPAVPALPVKDFGGDPTKASEKSKRLSDMANRYDEYIKANPNGIKSVGYGESTGVKVLPEARGGANVPNVLIRGGEMVRSYTNNEDAMAVGVAPNGDLAIRTYPEGVFDTWNVTEREVRKSLLKPKRTVEY